MEGGWALKASRRAAASCARLFEAELLPARPEAACREVTVLGWATKFWRRCDAADATDSVGDAALSAAGTLEYKHQIAA